MEHTIGLIINAGSSSVKYSLFINGRSTTNIVYEKKGGGYERSVQLSGKKTVHLPISQEIFSHSTEDLLDYLVGTQLINVAEDITIIGHRVVHGGDLLRTTTLIDSKVLGTIKSLEDIAPLHNPPAARIIEQCMQLFSAPMYAVLDTAFHSTMPEVAYTYELPRQIREEYKIRKYGFHGISYASIVRQLEQHLPSLPHRIVACHLGGGASICAIVDGKSVDTSMGFSPLEGLMMMTRPGDIDAGALLYVEEHIGSHERIEHMLNKESGVLAITEGIDDMREVIRLRHTHKGCALALDMFTYRVRKYIGAYIAAMGGIDALIFSGGIGEGSELIRSMICDELAYAGVSLDSKENDKNQTLSPLQKNEKDVLICTVSPKENEEIYMEIMEKEGSL